MNPQMTQQVIDLLHTRTRWLYLPDNLLWINPDLIETISAWHDDDDPSLIVSYTIECAGRPDHGDIEVESDADISAVTAWLEGRS